MKYTLRTLAVVLVCCPMVVGCSGTISSTWFNHPVSRTTSLDGMDPESRLLLEASLNKGLGGAWEANIRRWSKLPQIFAAETPEVQYFVSHYLSGKGRGTLEVGLSRREQYAPVMIRVLAESGLPLELINLPFVESLYREDAQSPSGAVGIWQFMSATARRHGLKVGFFVDERKDVALSTKAAASYLRDLYDMFDDWHLALGAYNCGETRMKDAIKQGGTRDFFELSRRGLLPRETKEFVPKFLALTRITEDPRAHGLNADSLASLGATSEVSS